MFYQKIKIMFLRRLLLRSQITRYDGHVSLINILRHNWAPNIPIAPNALIALNTPNAPIIPNVPIITFSMFQVKLDYFVFKDWNFPSVNSRFISKVH